MERKKHNTGRQRLIERSYLKTGSDSDREKGFILIVTDLTDGAPAKKETLWRDTHRLEEMRQTSRDKNVLYL